MGEVVSAHTTPTLHPPYPAHCAVIIQFKSVPVHQLSWLALKVTSNPVSAHGLRQIT